MIAFRSWHHDRTFESVGDDSTRVTDRVAFEPRARLFGPVGHLVVSRLFRHRHCRLRRLSDA
jgi:ligand-binding SRPBCC domain-containing protein